MELQYAKSPIRDDKGTRHDQRGRLHPIQVFNTLDGAFCLAALRLALRHSRPEIFNTDQGVQFAAHAFTSEFEAAAIRISMDGRGRVFDNIFVERLWRTVKIDFANANDYARIRLDVIDSNSGVRKLYERVGFAGTKTEDFEFLRGILGFGAATTMVYNIP